MMPPSTLTMLDTARAALACIPAVDRDTWLRMSMALKAEFGDEAFSLWHEWSRTACNYSLPACQQVWRSITPEGGITIATLFYEARQHGFRGTDPIPSASPTRERQAERDRLAHGAEAEKHARQAKAAVEAKRIWNAATPAPPDHPYLVMKGVRPYGVRVYHDRLVVPIYRDGALVSVELIDAQGDKKYLKDSAKQGGSFCVTTCPSEAKALLQCEGYATAASLHASTGLPVVVCFDASNYVPVAKAMRETFPGFTIIACADNDLYDDPEKKNTGVVAATAAAQAIGGWLAVPDLDGKKCDFNDVHQQKGAEAVCHAVKAAIFLGDTMSDPETKASAVKEPGMASNGAEPTHHANTRQWSVSDQGRHDGPPAADEGRAHHGAPV